STGGTLLGSARVQLGWWQATLDGTHHGTVDDSAVRFKGEKKGAYSGFMTGVWRVVGISRAPQPLQNSASQDVAGVPEHATVEHQRAFAWVEIDVASGCLRVVSHDRTVGGHDLDGGDVARGGGVEEE